MRQQNMYLIQYRVRHIWSCGGTLEWPRPNPESRILCVKATNELPGVRAGRSRVVSTKSLVSSTASTCHLRGAGVIVLIPMPFVAVLVHLLQASVQAARARSTTVLNVTTKNSKWRGFYENANEARDRNRRRDLECSDDPGGRWNRRSSRRLEVGFFRQCQWVLRRRHMRP